MKNESIKYCIQDCKSLYQVLDKFNELIFDKFNLNIHNSPTLSSLAFNIFRAHYLKDSKIPLIGGNMLNDIRAGYFGCAERDILICINQLWMEQKKSMFMMLIHYILLL